MKRSRVSKTAPERRPTGRSARRACVSQQQQPVPRQKFASPPCYLAEFFDVEDATRPAK